MEFEMIKNLLDNMDIFTALNIAIVLASLVLIGITVAHYRFFKDSIQNELARRIKHALLADTLSGLSILSFNGTVFIPGGYVVYQESIAVRVALKVFQLLTVLYTVRAYWLLLSYYKKVK